MTHGPAGDSIEKCGYPAKHPRTALFWTIRTVNPLVQASPNNAIDELIETFDFLGDWEERYAHLIDMGRKLPPMDPADQVEENRVRGCQSTVWLVARVHDEEDPPRLEFIADSDAHIVKGLIAILQTIYSGQSPQFVLDYDAQPIFERLGLSEHLSTGRRNGLSSMIKRIKALAKEHADGHGDGQSSTGQR